MRDILKKLATGSMIAGAALFVAACGGGADTATTNTDMGNDTMYEANDMTMDTNMTMDENMMGMDANATATDANMSMDANATAADTNAVQ